MLISAKIPIDHRTFSAFWGKFTFLGTLPVFCLNQTDVLSGNIVHCTNLWCFFPTIWPFKLYLFQMDERPDRCKRVLSDAWVYSKVEDKPRPRAKFKPAISVGSGTPGPAEKHLRCGRSWDFGSTSMSSDFFFLGGSRSESIKGSFWTAQHFVVQLTSVGKSLISYDLERADRSFKVI